MRKILITATLFGTLACGKGQIASETKIVNGMETNLYPEIGTVTILFDGGQTDSACTGFFLTKTVFVTTAHCLMEASAVEYNGIISADILLNPQYNFMALDADSTDIAMVKFDTPVSASFLSLTQHELVHGEKMTMVGFGLNNILPPFDFSQINTKRYGTNEYNSRIQISDKQIVVESTTQDSASGKNVGPSYSDSGAPLLNAKGQVVGFALRTMDEVRGNDKSYKSVFYKFNTNESKEFLKLAAKKHYL